MIQQIEKGITYAESTEADVQVRATVEGMLANGAARGDAALRDLSKRLDNWSPASFRLSAGEIDTIIATLPQQVLNDIHFSPVMLSPFL